MQGNLAVMTGPPPPPDPDDPLAPARGLGLDGLLELLERLGGEAAYASRVTRAAISRAMRERGTTRSKPAASARSFTS